MIRLTAKSNPPSLPVSRASPTISGQSGTFALALASQQPSRPTNQPAAIAAPTNDDDRQDLAAAGSGLPEASDPPVAALPEPGPAEPSPPVGLRQPDWRFAAKPGDDAVAAQGGDGDADSGTGGDSSEDDATAVTPPVPLPALVAPIAQPVPQPAADTPTGTLTDATADAAIAGQNARDARFRNPQPPVDLATQTDQTNTAPGAAAPAGKLLGEPAPSLAAIAPFASGAKASTAAKPDTPAIEPKAEPAPPAAAAVSHAAIPAAAPQPHIVPQAAVAASSLAAAPLPVRSATLPRRHVLESLDGIAAGSLGTPGALAGGSVRPTGDSQQPTLDLGRQDWMASMIDQIETLRDADGGRTARIRLNPDAMGTVDISVRHDGDGVHVHFASETAATRTLLGDSAPALAQLAEQRGIRLSQSSVDAGAGQAGNQQRQDAQQSQPNTASAPASAQAEQAEATDDRIA